MSSPQHEWLVRIQDRADASQLRQSSFAAHQEYLQTQVQEGRVTLNADIYSKDQLQTEDKHICGSVQVVKGTNEQIVWEVLRADPYAEQRVWDLDNTTVAPLKVGIMKPL